jgi:hypothetical protein
MGRRQMLLVMLEIYNVVSSDRLRRRSATGNTGKEGKTEKKEETLIKPYCWTLSDLVDVNFFSGFCILPTQDNLLLTHQRAHTHTNEFTIKIKIPKSYHHLAAHSAADLLFQIITFSSP